MKYSILSATIFILIALFSAVSHASPLLSSSYIQFAQNNNQGLNRAVKSIKQKTGGRILSAKTVKKNGQRIYKIKVLLPSGKVQTFRITAQ
jgi:uncharacterized membrane protein YkoI